MGILRVQTTEQEELSALDSRLADAVSAARSAIVAADNEDLRTWPVKVSAHEDLGPYDEGSPYYITYLRHTISQVQSLVDSVERLPGEITRWHISDAIQRRTSLASYIEEHTAELLRLTGLATTALETFQSSGSENTSSILSKFKGKQSHTPYCDELRALRARARAINDPTGVLYTRKQAMPMHAVRISKLQSTRYTTVKH
jgi:hypothetical protein